MPKTDSDYCRTYRERRKARGLPLTRGEPRTPEQEKIYQKAYRTRPEVKASERLRSQKIRNDPKNAQKLEARKILNSAVRYGKLKRQPCKCGNPKTEGHHADHSKPLEVEWLCKSCHMKTHTRIELYCDGSEPHSRLKESRVFPISDDANHGNMILCRLCFNREIAFRKDRNKELGKDCQFKLPTWDSLKIYDINPPTRTGYTHSRSLR